MIKLMLSVCTYPRRRPCSTPLTAYRDLTQVVHRTGLTAVFYSSLNHFLLIKDLVCNALVLHFIL